VASIALHRHPNRKCLIDTSATSNYHAMNERDTSNFYVLIAVTIICAALAVVVFESPRATTFCILKEFGALIGAIIGVSGAIAAVFVNFAIIRKNKRRKLAIDFAFEIADIYSKVGSTAKFWEQSREDELLAYIYDLDENINSDKYGEIIRKLENYSFEFPENIHLECRKTISTINDLSEILLFYARTPTDQGVGVNEICRITTNEIENVLELLLNEYGNKKTRDYFTSRLNAGRVAW
jgi:hypothetical protein